jgi:hypothetical protein
MEKAKVWVRWNAYISSIQLLNMSVYCDPRETDAIRAILKEICGLQQYSGLESEHIVQLVAIEAEKCGIKPQISEPIARMLIEE